MWQRSYNVSRPSKPSFGDKIVGQTYPPGFVLPRVLKVVRLARAEAEGVGASMPSLIAGETG